MRLTYTTFTQKIAGIFIMFIIALTITGYTYSHWQDEVHITGTVSTTYWKACVKIMKTRDGAYTDPETGEDLSDPTDLIAIANETFPTKFNMTIYVKNCGSTKLTHVEVKDTIKNTVIPINLTKSKGTVSWVNHTTGGHFVQNHLTWNIGTLASGEEAWLEIWIETLQNSAGKYVPTSEHEDIEINGEVNEDGATVSATSPFKELSATTDSIILNITDDDNPDNEIGKISSPELPYSTPWAKDRYP